MTMVKREAEMLVVSDLHVSFGERKVLDGISFEIRKNEICGLLGPNGSGKSTLLGAVAGVGKKEKGEVFAEGLALSATSRRDVARRVAVVPQQTLFTMPFTVLETVLMGRFPAVGRFGKISTDDIETAQRALKMVDLEGFDDRLVTELSGGESQRVAIARALAQETNILLLDEPASALDPRHALSVYGLLREKRREGSAILIALHDINSALQWCDRIFFLKNGRLFDVRKPEQVDTLLLAAIFDVSWTIYPLPDGGSVAFPRA